MASGGWGGLRAQRLRVVWWVCWTVELNLSSWIAAELTQKANESRPQGPLDGHIGGGGRLNHIEGKSGA